MRRHTAAAGAGFGEDRESRMTTHHRRPESRARTGRAAIAPILTALIAASAQDQPVPFDSLHCPRVRDSRLHGAALRLLASDGDLA